MSRKELSVEVITVGREILDGRVLDSNTRDLASYLGNLGLRLHYSQSVDDDPKRLFESFKIAKSRSQLVFVTGGLGPTEDDLTIETFAEFVGQPLELCQKALKTLMQKVEQRPGLELVKAQLKQCMLPKGAASITNPIGTACAVHYKAQETEWYFVPGVPREWKAIWKNIQLNLPVQKNYRQYSWYTQFTSESKLQTQLTDFMNQLPENCDLSFRTHFPENHITLSAVLDDGFLETDFEALKLVLNTYLDKKSFYKGSPIETEGLFESLTLEKLREKQIKLATVESCTGGLIAHKLTSVSGSSDVYVGSRLTYSNDLKVNIGVDEHTIKINGAVSDLVAKKMSSSYLSQLEKIYPQQSLVVLSTTGIAGPTGGSQDKPVGTCFIALSHNLGAEVKTSVLSVPVLSHLNRLKQKEYFSRHALSFLNKAI